MNKNETAMWEWQKDCLHKINGKSYVIVSSPTGTGKTIVFLNWALSKAERPIYITAPIKALSNQRYRELKKAGYTVGIETGDIKRVPKACDFICCTQEIYTSKYASDDKATVIIDEFHYIYENSDRARAYIDGLRNSKARNILICSATFGDVTKLEDYLKKVTGKDFYTFENKNRCTELTYARDINDSDIKDALIVAFSRRNCHCSAQRILDIRRNLSNEYLDEGRLKKIKVIEDKLNINNSELQEYIRYGVAIYYGSLLPKEKLFVEKLFEEKLIDIVVGTDALALGVNFPVENVIFSQLSKYDGLCSNRISKNLFTQLSGRTGRSGFFEHGYIYYSSSLNSLYDYPEDIEFYYDTILESDNEDMSIVIKPSISKILKGESTIEDEIKYASDYSTLDIDIEEIANRLINSIDYIDMYSIDYDDFECLYYYEDDFYDFENYEYYNKIYKKNNYNNPLLIKNECQVEFDANIEKAYFDEFDEIINCKLFSKIVKHKSIEQIIEESNGVFDDFYNLLKLKKYVERLPKKYKSKLNLKFLRDKINSIDETALSLKNVAA